MPAPARTVVLLEDDADISELMAQLITSYGATPVLCRDQAEIFTALEHHDVALALLDIMLPAVDGRTVAAALRARKVAFPVYFMTGIRASAIGDNYSALADGVLHKPFSIHELREILDRTLTERPAPTRSGETHRGILELMAAVATEQEGLRREQGRILSLLGGGDPRQQAEQWREVGMALEAGLARMTGRLDQMRRLLAQMEG